MGRFHCLEGGGEVGGVGGFFGGGGGGEVRIHTGYAIRIFLPVLARENGGFDATSKCPPGFFLKLALLESLLPHPNCHRPEVPANFQGIDHNMCHW